LGAVRLGAVRLGAVRLGAVRLGAGRLGAARLGAARLGVAFEGVDVTVGVRSMALSLSGRCGGEGHVRYVWICVSGAG
jgi:hypothetical protein